MSPDRQRSSERRPFWKAGDRRVLVRLVVGGVAAAVLPRRVDGWFMRTLARRTERNATSRAVAGLEDQARSVLQAYRPDLDVRSVAVEARIAELEQGWLRARATLGRRLTVETSVDGLERLRRDGGRRGGLLWGLSFCGTLVVKIGLSRAGVDLIHLSEAGHGGAYPPSRLGLSLVSPLYCRAENRFLWERVVIPPDGSLGYVRTLIQRLEDGHAVYIAGERVARRQNVVVPCLGRPTPFARGAPGLAHRTGVPLLPVTVVRDGPLRYRVVIEEPIDVDRSLGREEFIRRAIAQFTERITRNVVEHPADRDWYRHGDAGE